MLKAPRHVVFLFTPSLLLGWKERLQNDIFCVEERKILTQSVTDS